MLNLIFPDIASPLEWYDPPQGPVIGFRTLPVDLTCDLLSGMIVSFEGMTRAAVNIITSISLRQVYNYFCGMGAKKPKRMPFRVTRELKQYKQWDAVYRYQMKTGR